MAHIDAEFEGLYNTVRGIYRGGIYVDLYPSHAYDPQTIEDQEAYNLINLYDYKAGENQKPVTIPLIQEKLREYAKHIDIEYAARKNNFRGLQDFYPELTIDDMTYYLPSQKSDRAEMLKKVGFEPAEIESYEKRTAEKEAQYAEAKTAAPQNTPPHDNGTAPQTQSPKN